jgi:hypothetical protein
MLAALLLLLLGVVIWKARPVPGARSGAAPGFA